jgi:hypothetical protein
MLSFADFIAEGLVYGDDEFSGSGRFSKQRVDDMDPHKYYENHYGKLLHLNFIHSNSRDAREKQQAHKEMQFAQKKLDFWSKHPKFDVRKATEITTRLKKMWNVR